MMDTNLTYTVSLIQRLENSSLPGAMCSAFVAGGGGVKRVGRTGTVSGVVSLNVTPQVGFYDCYNNGPNSLVGAAVDPTGHGGVDLVSFGSYDLLAPGTIRDHDRHECNHGQSCR